MPVVSCLLAWLLIQAGAETQEAHPRSAPVYSAASIVNGADNKSGELAPNTIGTVYGSNLAYTTWALTPGDIKGGRLPDPRGKDVILLIRGEAANLYYVSPTQVNFLVPPDLLPGPADVQLVIDGWAGKKISIKLAAVAPALFQLDAHNAVATRANGSVITPAAPARPGDMVVLYATGLGATTPPAAYGLVPTTAAPLTHMADFKVLLGGVAVDPKAVAYAGIAPGFAGLYQINVRLPSHIKSANPEIRVGMGSVLSIPALKLPVKL